jgi:hypothetical protein
MSVVSSVFSASRMACDSAMPDRPATQSPTDSAWSLGSAGPARVGTDQVRGRTVLSESDCPSRGPGCRPVGAGQRSSFQAGSAAHSWNAIGGTHLTDIVEGPVSSQSGAIRPDLIQIACANFLCGPSHAPEAQVMQLASPVTAGISIPADAQRAHTTGGITKSPGEPNRHGE